MKKKTNLPFFALLVCSSAVLADDWTSFDLAIGTPLVVRRQELALRQGTACEFQANGYRYDEEWAASMDIVFSATGDLSGNSPDEKSVSLSLSRTVTDNAGRFSVHSYGFNDDWDNDFRVGTDVGSDLEMIFGWLSESTFEYQIRDGQDEPYFGVVVVSEFESKFAIVVVAGIEGRIKCRAVGL